MQHVARCDPLSGLMNCVIAMPHILRLHLSAPIWPPLLGAPLSNNETFVGCITFFARDAELPHTIPNTKNEPVFALNGWLHKGNQSICTATLLCMHIAKNEPVPNAWDCYLWVKQQCIVYTVYMTCVGVRGPQWQLLNPIVSINFAFWLWGRQCVGHTQGNQLKAKCISNLWRGSCQPNPTDPVQTATGNDRLTCSCPVWH